jgi:hypothetical protein
VCESGASLMSRRWKIEEYGRNGNDAHLSEIYRSHEDFFSLAPARFLRRRIPTSNKRFCGSQTFLGLTPLASLCTWKTFCSLSAAFWYGNCTL